MKPLLLPGVLLLSGLMSGAWYAPSARAADFCLSGVCLGDDVETLSVKWKPQPPSVQEKIDADAMLASRPVREIYQERNELLVTDDNTLKALYPYVVRRLVFDRDVLDTLRQVRAFCSSTTLTGELELEGRDRIFVTFRAVPDKTSRGRLRVIGLEQQFDISPLLRPADKARDKAKRAELRTRYADLREMRDLDAARVASTEDSLAPALLGYRFHSEVNIPLTLRLRDTAEFEMLENARDVSPLCKDVRGNGGAG